MYHVTQNQKEQLLCKILTALELASSDGKSPVVRFLIKMYLKVQNLHIGGSLEPAEASRLKKLLSSNKN